VSANLKSSTCLLLPFGPVIAALWACVAMLWTMGSMLLNVVAVSQVQCSYSSQSGVASQVQCSPSSQSGVVSQVHCSQSGGITVAMFTLITVIVVLLWTCMLRRCGCLHIGQKLKEPTNTKTKMTQSPATYLYWHTTPRFQNLQKVNDHGCWNQD
jgi:hypothetical protein